MAGNNCGKPAFDDYQSSIGNLKNFSQLQAWHGLRGKLASFYQSPYTILVY
jgi:hypothetical protein